MGFDFQEWYSSLSNAAVILSHKGAITPEVIEHFLEAVENKLEQSEESNKIRRKVYNVLVETLQNLFHHLDTPLIEANKKTDTELVAVIFSKEAEKYKITTANLMLTEKVEGLQARLEQINALSKDELKALYREILDNQEFSKKGGGGLGMIDIARKTGSKLNYRFYTYNEAYDFFIFSILI